MRRTNSVIAAFTVIAGMFTFVPGLRAGQSEQAAVSQLTTGRWQFHGHTRMFNADGTFTSDNGATGMWRIKGGELEIAFQSGSVDRFFLPIDPSGTRGADPNGLPEMMVKEGAKTQLHPLRKAQDVQEAVALLTTGEWQFHGNLRRFNRDGTFSSSNGAAGTWKIAHGELDITFPTGSVNRFFLPIDPFETRGVDNFGQPEIMTQVNTSPNRTILPGMQQPPSAMRGANLPQREGA